jgi:hypothetical protein
VKFFCSILAIIMLVLSCIPCSDAEGLAMEQTSVSTTAPPPTEQPGKTGQDHKDLCSPFCQCSCCAVAYALPVSFVPEVVVKIAITEKVFASYLQQQPVGIALPIWQPPQLV